MNLILLSKHDFVAPKRVRLTGRRFEHLTNIVRVKVGQELTVGRLNGLIGSGTVMGISSEALELQVKFQDNPPEALDLTVIMALPRPPMLKRTLQCASSLGIKKIIILNFARVDKSLWLSSALKPEAIQEDLVLGLEQAKDTILPKVTLVKQFKPFVEDKLPALIKGKKAYVAHPGSKSTLPKAKAEPSVIIIGPEGGLVDFEIDLLKSKGVKPITLGTRILRFENVLPFVVGKIL